MLQFHIRVFASNDFEIRLYRLNHTINPDNNASSVHFHHFVHRFLLRIYLQIFNFITFFLYSLLNC